MEFLKQIIANLFNLGVGIVSSFGYFGIFLGMTIESASIPLPSEAIMGFAGYLVATGTFEFWPVVIAGTLGNGFGSSLLYLFGKYGGLPFLKKYGKWLTIHEEEIERAEKWFQRYGEISIFFAQMLPVVRTFVSFPGGLLEIKYTKFIIYTLAGAFIWCTFLVYLGMTLGQNWEQISTFLAPFQNIIIALAIIVSVLVIYFRVKVVIKRRGNH